MRTHEAARYARWSAVAAVALALVVAGVYARRTRRGSRAVDAAPVPASVEQQSDGFSFSKEVGNQTQFTVRASRATQFKEGNRALLENVWVTSYGAGELRADNLRTQSCEYGQDNGLITCAGEVQMDLQSAADASLHGTDAASLRAAARVMHIHTSQITFDSRAGIATTDKPVDFQIPQGQGSGVGVHYESRLGELRLLHDVHITLHPQPPASAVAAPQSSSSASPASTAAQWAADGDVQISAGGLIYRRDDHVVQFTAPVEITQGDRTLRGPDVEVLLDDAQHIRKILATGRPAVSAVQDGDPVALTADQITAELSESGVIDRITAAGNVQSDRKAAAGTDRLSAQQLELLYAGDKNQLSRMTAQGNVVLDSVLAAGGTRHMATATLRMDFVPMVGGGDVRLAHAVTPAVTLDAASQVQTASPSGPQQQLQNVRLTSQQMEANFGEQSDLRDLHASGGVALRRQLGDAVPVTSTSRDLTAEFAPGGQWSVVDQAGDVHLQDGDKAATAPRAHFDRLAETSTLSGSIVVTDPSSRTTAQSGTFLQASNEFRAEGNVVTSELPAAGANAPGATAPVASRLAADRLTANTGTNHAVYSGHARLWQGDSVVEADSVELDHDAQTLTAIGRVRAVFPQSQTGPAMPGVPLGSSKPVTSSKPVPPSKPPSKLSSASGAPAAPPKPSAASRSSAASHQPTPRPSSGDPVTSPVPTNPVTAVATAASPAQPQFMHASAGRLTYVAAEHRARLEQSAVAQSAQGTMHSSSMDLFFIPQQGAASASANAPAPAASPDPAVSGFANQTLDRVTALGDVEIDGADRHARGGRADYTATDGKFVISGGYPTVYDASGNSAAGRQLTFVFGDDRIVVDSDQGTRTLTLHRVEK